MDTALLTQLETRAASAAAALLVELAAGLPVSYYFLGTLFFFFIFVYNFLEFHFIGDVLRGCRGDRVSLTFNKGSDLCQYVVSRCQMLHGRYLTTPWLASPHLQTAFIHYVGNSPAFSYTRQVLPVSGEDVVALDWLLAADVEGFASDTKNTISKDDTTPIVVVLPGLTGDSACPYVQHLVYKIAKRGWNVVVGNPRGLGGIPVKTDCHYCAGFTADIRKVANHLHQEYPRAPLFAVGMSLGANILVKYLGEDGELTPVSGAASICSPWDLVVCERFLCRKFMQRVYNRALASALKGFAEQNHDVYSKFVDWESVKKSRFLREFDSNGTCHVANYETPDTYYRQSSSVYVVGNVSVPLLCISALDDPICTKEVIPWDECRANKNIVLATTEYGGHLGFFKGLTASSLWWVEAVDEFLSVLHSSPFMHVQKKMPAAGLNSSQEPSIDNSSYITITEDGNAKSKSSEEANLETDKDLSDDQAANDQKVEYTLVGPDQQGKEREASKEDADKNTKYSGQKTGSESYITSLHGILFPVKKPRGQISRRNMKSIWLLVYIAVVTTWPLVGPVFLMAFKRKLKNVIPATILRR